MDLSFWYHSLDSGKTLEIRDTVGDYLGGHIYGIAAENSFNVVYAD